MPQLQHGQHPDRHWSADQLARAHARHERTGGPSRRAIGTVQSRAAVAEQQPPVAAAAGVRASPEDAQSPRRQQRLRPVPGVSVSVTRTRVPGPVRQQTGRAPRVHLQPEELTGL